MKCVNLNSLLATTISRPQTWRRPRKLKFWIMLHCWQLHTFLGTYHKGTQQNVLIIHGDTKKRELLKPPTKIEEIQEKHLLTEIEQLQLAF